MLAISCVHRPCGGTVLLNLGNGGCHKLPPQWDWAQMSVSRRHNVAVSGSGAKTMLLAHGYGCDQTMWRFVAPAFATDYKTVLIDLAGSGNSDLSEYDHEKYATLHGHAADILEICDELALTDVVFVGHSVSAMIGVLAANRAPGRFSNLVMIGPSPYYINDGDYIGGFTRQDIDGLLELLEANYFGWTSKFAPVIMGVPGRPELAEELANSFCRTDPEIAQHFGRVTFLSDHRVDVKKVATPSLILQCSNDLIAPIPVGEWLHRSIPRSSLVIMQATGHCPHLSAPEETIAAILDYLK